MLLWQNRPHWWLLLKLIRDDGHNQTNAPSCQEQGSQINQQMCMLQWGPEFLYFWREFPFCNFKIWHYFNHVMIGQLTWSHTIKWFLAASYNMLHEVLCSCTAEESSPRQLQNFTLLIIFLFNLVIALVFFCTPST